MDIQIFEQIFRFHKKMWCKEMWHGFPSNLLSKVNKSICDIMILPYFLVLILSKSLTTKIPINSVRVTIWFCNWKHEINNIALQCSVSQAVFFLFRTILYQVWWNMVQTRIFRVFLFNSKQVFMSISNSYTLRTQIV